MGVRSDLDTAQTIGMVGVVPQGLIERARSVALDRQPQSAAQSGDVVKGDVAQFRASKAKITKPERQIRIGPRHRVEQPCCGGIGCEEFYHGRFVQRAVVVIGHKLTPLVGGEKAGIAVALTVTIVARPGVLIAHD